MQRRLAGIIMAASCMSVALARGSDGTSASGTAGTEEIRKLPGGAVLRVAPGGSFSIKHPLKLQLDARGGSTLSQTVSLGSGRVEVDLPLAKTPTSAVLIQAPHKVSAVAKGGHGVVIASGNRVFVGAISGDMLVAVGNDWRPLPAGTVREFPLGGAPSDHAVLPAPTLSLSTPVALNVATGSDSHAAIQARASVVPRAASYEFGLFRVQGNERRLLRRIASADGALKLDDVTPGSYSVSVRAVEASGLEGAESEASALRVVAAELPDGARLTAHGISIAPSQRVQLRGTEGIELSYGKASDFISAPDSIGLIRGEATLVRLRAKGSKEELSLVLAPRSVRADIQLGPARARWPRDEVRVSVTLRDALGQPLGDDVSVNAKAYVNVTPANVQWTRQHNVLSATVPASVEPGPWVVRVEVADDTGSVVGHDFLEVAPSPLARN